MKGDIMSFLDDYKLTLQKTLQDGQLIQARSLIKSFHQTGISYDADLYYLEAALCYYECHYAAATLYARLGFERFPEYAPLKELLSCLAEGEKQFDEYLPRPTFDCTACHKRLHIVIYENVSSLIDYTAEQFHRIFELLGHEVFIFHHNDFDQSSKELLDFAKKGIDFALLFNNVGIQITTDNVHSIWDVLGITCFNYLFDHPLYYPDAMNQMPSHGIVTCVDKNHVRYIKRFHSHVKQAFYSPLGGEFLTHEELIPWSDRPIDVLYVGSLKTVKDAPVSALSDQVTEYLLTHTEQTTEDAFETCLRAGGNIISDSLLQQTIYQYRFTDMHINSHFRQKLIEVLVKNGIHVTVYGYGWEQVSFFESPFFHYGGVLDQADCIRKMYQSKIVLNSMPWFKDGTHDRIFNAMLSHAVCVTDESRYMKDHFTDGHELIYYQLDKMQELPGIIRYLLENPFTAARIAENGFQSSILSHTWEARGIELLTRFFQHDFN